LLIDLFVCPLIKPYAIISYRSGIIVVKKKYFNRVGLLHQFQIPIREEILLQNPPNLIGTKSIFTVSGVYRFPPLNLG